MRSLFVATLDTAVRHGCGHFLWSSACTCIGLISHSLDQQKDKFSFNFDSIANTVFLMASPVSTDSRSPDQKRLRSECFVESVRSISDSAALTKCVESYCKQPDPHAVPAFVEDGGRESRWPTLLDPPSMQDLATDKVTFVALEHGCFDAKQTNRMIRWGEHPRMWALLEQITSEVADGKETKVAGLLLLGHPGLGKTMSLDLLLSWSLKAHPNRPVIVVSQLCISIFVLHDGRRKRYFTRTTGTNELALVEWMHHGLGLLEDTPILVLHDLKTPEVLGYNSSLITELHERFRVTCVVASSPSESNFKRFVKETTPYKFCVPVLSDVEAQAFMKEVRPDASPAEVEEAFRQVGGVPRHLRTQQSAKVAFENQNYAVKSLTWFNGFPLDASSKVICLIPYDDRTRVAARDFITAGARRKWIDCNDSGAILTVLRSLARYREAEKRDVYGRMFGQFVIKKIRSGECTALDVKLMNADGSVNEASELLIPEKMNICEFNDGMSASALVLPTTTPTLYVPLARNFPIGEALLVTPSGDVTVFQITVADEHQPSGKALRDLVAELKSKNLKLSSFVWIVDHTSELNKWQSIQNDTGACSEYTDAKHYLHIIPTA